MTRAAVLRGRQTSAVLRLVELVGRIDRLQVEDDLALFLVLEAEPLRIGDQGADFRSRRRPDRAWIDAVPEPAAVALEAAQLGLEVLVLEDGARLALVA